MALERCDGLTRRGVGWGIGGLAAGLLARAAGEGASAKNKKRKKKTKRCKLCPDGCLLVFYEPGGGRICGQANNLLIGTGTQCVQCTTFADCGGNAPHCLNSVQNVSTGAITYFTGVCGSYPQGVCATVAACVS